LCHGADTFEHVLRWGLCRVLGSPEYKNDCFKTKWNALTNKGIIPDLFHGFIPQTAQSTEPKPRQKRITSIYYLCFQLLHKA